MLAIKQKLLIFFLILLTTFSYAENLQTKQLNILFESLSKIDNVNDGNLLEKKIWNLWNQHPHDDNLTYKLELGTQLMYEGNYQYALQVFSNVVKSDPTWSEAWNKRATLLFFMEDYQKSLNDIENVLIIEPRHFGALSGRAQIFIKLEKYQKAIDDLKKAKKIHPVIKSNFLIPELEKLIKGLSV
tara:strand:+ start:408 stop:965 length:558 start_codon:yes stop_codon:yes gene_type:complete